MAVYTPDIFSDELIDNGSLSLREAVIAANTSEGQDVIELVAGTYSLDLTVGVSDSEFGDLDITDDLIIRRKGEGDVHIIGGSGEGDFSDRIIEIHSDVTASLAFLNIGGGTVSGVGGGVSNWGELTAVETTISGNRSIGDHDGDYGGFSDSGAGGGLYNASGATARLTSSTVELNESYSKGGGIYNAPGGMLLLSDSEVFLNFTSSDAFSNAQGGGIYNGGNAQISGSSVSDNVALGFDGSAQGGGIYSGGAYYGGNLEVHNSSIHANFAAGVLHSEGGGIWTNSPTTINNSQVAYNTAGGYYSEGRLSDTAALGGGIYHRGTTPDSLQINDSSIEGNDAYTDYRAEGGGLWTSGDALLERTDVNFNSAGAYGGYYGDRSQEFSGSDTRAIGGGIYNGSLPSGPTSTLTIRDSNVNENHVESFGGYYGTALSQGGGIWNDASLAVHRTTIDGNSTYAFTRNGVSTAQGGGLFNTSSATPSVARTALVAAPIGGGQATIENSTLSWNGAYADADDFDDSPDYGGAVDYGGEARAEGGGIWNGAHPFGGTATAEIMNSTISGNGVDTYSGSLARGGGIFQASDDVESKKIGLNSATIADNFASEGAAIFNAGDSETGSVLIELQNSLLADSWIGDNLAGAGVTSLGYNLSDDASTISSFTDPDDLNDAIADLQPLANNGGPTQTHALGESSQAIDADGPAPATDQRGVERSGRNDIGAFESPALPPTVVDIALLGTDWSADAYSLPDSDNDGTVDRTVGFTNVDQVQVTFDQQPNEENLLGSLFLTDSSGNFLLAEDVEFVDNSFTTYTYVWTFSTTLGNDNYLINIEGESADVAPVFAETTGFLLNGGADTELAFSLLQGDASGDGVTNSFDFTFVVRDWFGDQSQESDINGDGGVDQFDYFGLYPFVFSTANLLPVGVAEDPEDDAALSADLDVALRTLLNQPI